MQAMLSVRQDEINKELIDLIKSLFLGNVDEIVIKKSMVTFEEFDSSLHYDDVVSQMSEYGYSEPFLNDIKKGLLQSMESRK